MHRFFAPTLDPGDDLVVLPRDEAEHLTRVLRIGAGETVAVFDGRGHEFLARVVAAVRRDVQLQLLSRVEPTPEPNTAITLVQAVLKGDKMDDVVRDAVMLGVAAIQPIVTKRSEVTIGALLRGARPDRWRRVALASVKQSRRATLPDIRTPLTLEHYLDEPPAALRLMLVEPLVEPALESLVPPLARAGAGEASEGDEVNGEARRKAHDVGDRASVSPVASLRTGAIPPDAAVLVGPEGGWDQAERAAAAAAGVRLISLGPRTLRADAVAIAALSILQFLWEA